MLTINKNNNFLSLKFKLILIFFKIKNNIIKTGNKIKTCLIKKIIGNFKWFTELTSSSPALEKAYLIVIKSLLNNQTKWGTKRIKNTSIDIKYLKSNFLSFKITI